MGWRPVGSFPVDFVVCAPSSSTVAASAWMDLLRFEAVATYPDLAFDERSLWVDEKNEKIYVVHAGNLLELALRKDPTG